MTETRKPGGRARTWPPAVAARRARRLSWAAIVSSATGNAAGRIASWAAVDFGPGRLVPWLPVAFGAGIVAYFAADTEPNSWAAVVSAGVGIAGAYFARNRVRFFPFALALAAAACGFAAATLKTKWAHHDILAAPVFSVGIEGFVEVREERERSDRIVVRVTRIEAPRFDAKPERIRVSVRKGTAPPVGSYAVFKARLNPPLSPLRPGGYDFARDLYFHQIGASGVVLGQIKTAAPPAPAGWRLVAASWIDGLRSTVDRRIRQTVEGDNGSIASALITGKRDAISSAVNDAMYVSSLAHILSISGYHMAVVAGIVFFVIRATLALFRELAERYSIKKWAALAALIAAAFYLVLSGAEVATQRAFIMAAIVLIGVMADRPAVTLRAVAVAALAVLLVTPEAIVHPSFQMSFAATVALVAGYQNGLPWFARAHDTSVGARIALWGGREVAGLIMASLLAGLATLPYAAFHFHRVAPYGVLANLLAMPIVSIWVMPAGILAVLALPFGFDAPFWRLMGEGIGRMTDVALWVASLPGAVGHVAAFGTGPLLVGTGGLLVVCLLKSPLRWSGAGLILVAAIVAMASAAPDVLISQDGRTVAFRTESGRLSIMKAGSDTFPIRDWLAADGDAREVKDASLNDAVRCDPVGCVGRLHGGRLIALSLSPEALEEDCRRAVLVVSPRHAPGACSALLIDRRAWATNGAHALRWNGDAFDVEAARPRGYDRPWAKSERPVSVPARAVGRLPSRDATPGADDLEPGD